jgi:hypothetical protein
MAGSGGVRLGAMSLLDNPDPAHEAVVNKVVKDLEDAGPIGHAILRNLHEEDRIPGAKPVFHAGLASSSATDTTKRIQDASRSALFQLPLPDPRPAAVCGSWRNYATLGGLQYKKLLDPNDPVDRDDPPRKLKIARLGSTDGRAFWITTAKGTDATDLRDRLGLAHVRKGEHMYRVRVEVDGAPKRKLYIPTVLDSGAYEAWRRPPPGHTDPWGMTRHLKTGDPAERELLALHHHEDPRRARKVGRVEEDPPKGYLPPRRAP